MQAFAALLDRVQLSNSRNAKLRLVRDFLRDTPDPERGWALAALTGDLTFDSAKPAMIRKLVEARMDPVLLGWSYDFVGDLADTVALVWPLASRYGLVTPDLAIPDAAVATRAALETEIDPHGVLTPEFRTQLVDAALQRRRELASQSDATSRTAAQPTSARLADAVPRLAAPSHDRSRLPPSDRRALEDEVDPRHVLTSEFRAEMVAAARARHQGHTSRTGQEPRVTQETATGFRNISDNP